MKYPAEAQEVFAAPQQAAFDFLLSGDHQNVIYGVLKRLHVYRSYPEYEDLIQEGRLAFVQCYQKAPATTREDEHRLLAYIYQGVYWQLLKCLDSQRRRAGHQTDDENKPQPVTDPQAQIESDQLYTQLLPLLSKNEQCYLTATYVDGLTVSEIARQMGVSRKSVYWWKAGVAQKAQIIWQRG